MYDDIFMCKSCSEGDRCQDGVKCVARWNYEHRIKIMKEQIALESRKIKERRCRNGDQRKDYRNDRKKNH